MISIGVWIELLQHWIYSVPIETWDIRDDTIGAFVGFVGAVILFALKRRIDAHKAE